MTPFPSFPSSAWERLPGGSASCEIVTGGPRRRVSPTCVPKQSLGARKKDVWSGLLKLQLAICNTLLWRLFSVNHNLISALTGFFPYLGPEIILGGAACMLFLGGTWRASRNLWGGVALVALIAAGLVLW